MAFNDSIDIISGLTEGTNRVSLKSVFSQFGEVEVCWVPPPNQRNDAYAFIRFKSKDIAALALQACSEGRVFLDGMPLMARARPNNAGPGSKGGKGEGRGGRQRGGRSRSSSSTPPRLREMERRRREQRGGGGGGSGRSRRSRSREHRGGRGRRDSRGRNDRYDPYGNPRR
mmetsp:Transcript_71876/g.191725  ORF Transcript_71876/g.191725 Transcript_71876/m.191725 type:complete len:171 (+) Transcript_71876:50-562(+)